MIFSQHYLGCLSHASYLIGDESTGRAVVVDPRRDNGVYLAEAAAKDLRIERVIETHLHADFLSGHLELAGRTGAVISFSEAADLDFPTEPLVDGQRITLGEVTLEIRATPGHTPESICVLVFEHAEDPVPYGALTGDTGSSPRTGPAPRAGSSCPARPARRSASSGGPTMPSPP
jgi:glyoxylase-like metal-dependent hydrolase (beta-lactamase superfamily II)